VSQLTYTTFDIVHNCYSLYSRVRTEHVRFMRYGVMWPTIVKIACYPLFIDFLAINIVIYISANNVSVICSASVSGTTPQSGLKHTMTTKETILYEIPYCC